MGTKQFIENRFYYYLSLYDFPTALKLWEEEIDNSVMEIMEELMNIIDYL